MKCPADGEVLVVAERSGVEIDYCPKCRGVWLDRGELDKIIDRAATVIPSPAPSHDPAAHRPEHNRDEGRFRDRDDDDEWKYRKGKRHRRESFLSDLFDF